MPLHRLAVLLLAVAVLPACSLDDDGGDTSSDGTTSGEMPSSAYRVTIVDDGCTYEGDAEGLSGPTLTMETDNQSSVYAYYGLSRVPDTYADVERDRLASGETFLVRAPSYFQELRHGGMASGLTGTILFEGLTEGTYVLWCATEKPPGAISVVEVLEVDA